MSAATITEQESKIAQGIHKLAPWHMDIPITNNISSGQTFDALGERVFDTEKANVSLISPERRFLNYIDKIYPNGMSGKRFLDCACNSGGYCFAVRSRDIDQAIGFDVREHWIEQAKFVQQHRTTSPTDRIHLQVMDLYDLPKQNLEPCDMTMFKGIFYHLPDPITGLKIAADLTREVMWFNTQTLWGVDDGYLKIGSESRDHVMSGVHGLKWYPTGYNVLAKILAWLGFVDLKLTYNKQNPTLPHLGRVEFMAAKKPGMLDQIEGETIEPFTDKIEKRLLSTD